MENTTPNTQEWVNHAIRHTLCDIGQLDRPTVAALNRLVKQGLLSKGKGGPFPAVKTVYAVAGFDFVADREAHVEYAMHLAKLDEQAARERRLAAAIQVMLTREVATHEKEKVKC